MDNNDAVLFIYRDIYMNIDIYLFISVNSVIRIMKLYYVKCK